MDTERMNLMAKLRSKSRMELEMMYDGPIPIEVIKSRIEQDKEDYAEYDNRWKLFQEHQKRRSENETNS